MNDDGDDDVSEGITDKGKSGAGGQSSGNNGASSIAQERHYIDNSTWKFGLNDFELQDYPLDTKKYFDVKTLESPVLWIRVDPDMEYIRKVKVIQEQNNWLF